jgi:hypothetical protein
MPEMRFQINQRTQQVLAKRAADAILDSVVSKARKEFTASKEAIRQSVDDAISNVQDGFKPTNEEAAELGIGEGGSIDFNRVDNAWRGLLSDSGTGAITVTFRTGRGKTGLGNIAIFIDFEKFYQYELCKLVVTTEGTDWDLEWMRWYIEGKAISDVSFFPTTSSRGASRTGRGIMIRGGLWQFRPHSEVVNELSVSLSEHVKRFITTFVAQEIGD